MKRFELYMDFALYKINILLLFLLRFNVGGEHLNDCIQYELNAIIRWPVCFTLSSLMPLFSHNSNERVYYFNNSQNKLTFSNIIFNIIN